MMEIVPSVDRWATRGVFMAPEGMDNFFNITFKRGHESMILVDGGSLSTTGNRYNELPGTPYAYIRGPISSGTHIITSTSDTVRWCAWNYGSLDGMQMGRSYGTPVAIATNIPCDDSVAITDVPSSCGSFIGTASIHASSGVCGALAMIYVDSSSNCTMTMEPALASGATAGTFVVKPVDPTRDATCVVRAVTRSGNYVERTYTYSGQQYIEAPAVLDFGVISPTTSVCRDITINNPSTTSSLTVHQLRTKSNSIGLTFPTGSFVLAPAEARTISLCLLLDKGQKYVDTLVAEVDCGAIILTAITGRANFIVGVHDDATITTPQILSVVPNPARDLITFHLATADAANIELVDITGTVVAQISTEPMHATAVLDVHTVASGTYRAVLRSRAGVSSMNVVVLP
ncbi:MAG: T9SS type A sorting domain-containing protein [Bacteroidetes bacterium]|nr:T9SS type A sorting domain-containing protein [Bacteroidota bacterium]